KAYASRPRDGRAGRKARRLPRRWSDSKVQHLRRSTQRFRCGGAWLADVLELGWGNDSSNHAGIALGYRRSKRSFSARIDMPAKKVLPFGAWPSPVTPELVAKGSRRFGTIQAAGPAIYWSESPPEQAGRAGSQTA